MDDLLLKGLIIGLTVAAPVGPIGILCMRRTLTEGRMSGLVSGLGAASADAVYGFIAGFGLTFITGFLVSQQSALRLVGGCFLCYLGLKTYFADTTATTVPTARNDLPTAYITTFGLTLTNPMTILSFAAIFSGLGIAGSGRDYRAAGILVLGVFLGSATWWLGLSSTVAYLRKSFQPGGLRWINRVTGIVLTGFGVLTLSTIGGG